MKTEKREIRIVVLDDSDFYNKLLTRQLESYTRTVSEHTNYRFSIESYVHADDCLRNLKEDTDIAFLDYYLGDGITAQDIMTEIKKKCDNCKVVIVSKAQNILTTDRTLQEGAAAFLYKLDKEALQKTCFFVDDVMKDLLE